MSCPEPGNNLNAPQLKNGYGKCGTFIPWNATKQKKYVGKWIDQEYIILSEVTQNDKYNLYSLISGFKT